MHDQRLDEAVLVNASITGGWGMSSYDEFEHLCAACGRGDGLVRTSRFGEIPFCEDCLERSFERTLWDDLGEVD